MKKISLLLSIGVLAFVLSVANFLNKNNPHHYISFSYKVTSTAITIKAIYNPEQAPQVEKYIDSCLQPEVVFGNKHKADKEVQISSSQLTYYIKGSPGTLKITADKESNSTSSLHKLKNILEGLKSFIK
jgi:hypothetical protein